MDGEKLDVGEILQRVSQVVRQSLGPVLLYVGALSAATIAVDLTSPDGGGINLLVSILGIAAGYLLIRAMVRDTGLTGDYGGGGFGAYFGLSILSGLGLVLGFFFLVIPGLILLVRWQPAFAIIMAEEDATVTGALSKAWEMTGDHFWQLLAATLIGVLVGGSGFWRTSHRTSDMWSPPHFR